MIQINVIRCTYVGASCDVWWVHVVGIGVHRYRPLAEPMPLRSGEHDEPSIEQGVIWQIKLDHLLELAPLPAFKGFVLGEDIVKVDRRVLEVFGVIDWVA